MSLFPRIKDLVRGVFARRSPKWPAVERHHLMMQPTCQACGGRAKLAVHHIKPFHLFPADELNPANLITLCEAPQRCHLEVGHHGNWKTYNPAVIAEAAADLAAHTQR